VSTCVRVCVCRRNTILILSAGFLKIFAAIMTLSTKECVVRARARVCVCVCVCVCVQINLVEQMSVALVKVSRGEDDPKGIASDTFVCGCSRVVCVCNTCVCITYARVYVSQACVCVTCARVCHTCVYLCRRE